MNTFTRLTWLCVILCLPIAASTTSQLLVGCGGLGNQGSLSLVKQFSFENDQALFPQVYTGTGAFSSTNYYHVPIFWSFVNITSSKMQSNYVLAVLRTNNGSTTTVVGESYLKLDESIVASPFAPNNSMQFMSVFMNPNEEDPAQQSLVYYLVKYNTSALSQFSALYSLNPRTNVSTLITDRYYPTNNNLLLSSQSLVAFVQGDSFICHGVTTDVNDMIDIQCKRKTRASDEWSVVKFELAGKNSTTERIQTTVETAKTFSFTSAASKRFLACMGKDEAAVCFQLKSDGVLMELLLPTRLPIQDAYSGITGDPWNELQFYLFARGEFIYGDLWMTRDGGKHWEVSVPRIAPVGRIISPLVPLKTFLYGGTTDFPDRRLMIIDAVSLSGLVSQQNVLEGFSASKYAQVIQFPFYFSSWIGTITLGLQGTNGRVTWNVTRSVNSTVYSVWSCVCSFRYNQSGTSVSSIVAGVGNSNQGASELNAQIVGASVGVICGAVTVILVLAGFSNI